MQAMNDDLEAHGNSGDELAVGNAPGAGALNVFPVDGTGSYHPAPGERSVTFQAAGAKAVAVKPGRVTFAQDAIHGTTASLAADGGWSFVYAGLAAALGVERDVMPGDAIGVVGQEAMTFVAVSPTGPVNPLPLFKELHAAPGQPGEDLPQLKVVPLPGRTDPGPVAKVNPPAPSPGEVPAPGPVIAKPGFKLANVPPWMLLAGAYLLMSASKRRR